MLIWLLPPRLEDDDLTDPLGGDLDDFRTCADDRGYAGRNGEQKLQLAEFGVDGQPDAGAFGSRRRSVQKALWLGRRG